MTIALDTQYAGTRVIRACRMASPFGELLIGIIGGRVCWLQIGDARDSTLLARFLRAHRIGDAILEFTNTPAAVRLELEAYFEGERREFSIPVDLMGTDFRKRVWEELQRIPYGTTITYSDLAGQIGNKNAVRAVGAAVGSNPVPIIVPCHRVVGSDGTLTGYAYGVDIKERLLVHEGALLA